MRWFSFVFLIVAISLAYAVAVESQVNSEMNDLFSDNDEADVIVVLKDDYNVLQEYGIQNYQHKDDFEMKKMMIGEQQENVFGNLKLKKKDKGISAQNNEDYDFELRNRYATVNGFAGKLKKSAYDKLKNNPNVLQIYKPKNISAFLSDSAGIINAARTWSLIYNGINITGKGETICVIDTGVDYTHPALGNCSNTSFLSSTCPKVISGYDFVNNDNDPIDDNGHGTHVAGIVASTNETIRGIALDSSIVAIKVLNSNSGGSDSNLISGIDWCVNNASKFNISVISMSLGTSTLFTSSCDNDSSLLTSSIANAIAKNISVIAATGNSGSTTGIASPACITNVTSVGGVDKSDNINFNRNNLTDLLAPGVNIKSLKSSIGCLSGCSCSGNFMTCSGTSMATPHVSGAFALLRQYKRLEQNSILTPIQIQNALNRTGKIINDSSGSGLLFSRINVYFALLSLDTIAPNITFVNPTPANGSNLSLDSTDFFVYINASSTEVLSSAILEINNGSKVNISMATNSLNSFINLTALKIGARTFRIYGNDSSGNQNITDLRVFGINNTAPNISAFAPGSESVTIAEPNNQTFSINFSDNENDTITVSWFLNNSLQISGINKSEFNVTGNLSAAGFFVVNVTLNDGSATTFKSWNLTVAETNTAPSVNSVNLTNTDFLNRTNGTLLAFWSFNDFDNDAITANETLWYVNNSLATIYANKTFIDPINTTKFENWTFSVRIFDGTNWSDFANSSKIKILNSKPSINTNTTSIILSETQQVNITLSASDIDNDLLNFTINDSRFFRNGDFFIWNTNLSDSGIYRFNITANDGLDNDSLLINITINDATDIDNDGNPDFNDTDKDNDGLNDDTDYLIGNISMVNTTIQNLSILIGNSSNLSRIFNETFTINFTFGNITLISFDFNFTKGADNLTNTLVEKQSQTLVVNGKDYLVTPTFIDAARAKLNVNSEVTNFLSAGDSYALSDGATIGVTGITYQNFAGGIHSVDLYLASKISRTLDLSKLTINKTTNGSSAVSIRGLSLPNSTKTIFLEKINATAKSVCIKDADIGFDSISPACDSANETLLNCDNSANGQYSCFDTGSRYKVTGLSHSAVKEECRDVDGDGYGTGCTLGNDCNDNDRSKTTDCSSGGGGGGGGGSSGGGSSGGGGGGGGASAGFVCNHEWKCSDWSQCENGLQSRQCTFVQVAQRFQDSNCQSILNAPATSQNCVVTNQLALSAETCSDGIKNQNEIGVDCGGICKPCESANANSGNSVTSVQQKTNGISGFAVKNSSVISMTASVLALAIAAIAILFFGIKLFTINNKFK